MPWLPDLSWLSGSLIWGITITIVTVTSALLALWWQHDKALKNPWSNKSLIMAAVCIAAGLVSIINLVQEDAESKAKDQQMAYLTAEVTGYRTTILSQAIKAESRPVHAMFVFHPKGIDYNRGLKDIDFEPDDPRVKLFFYQPLLASGSIEIDINTLFRYELSWGVKRKLDDEGKVDWTEITFGGGRKEVWDRMGFNANTFRNICQGQDNCDLMLDSDGDSSEPEGKLISSDDSGLEGRFGVIGSSPDGIFAISLSRNVTWSDIVRAVGAPFQSSWYGKGSYGAMRFDGVDRDQLSSLKNTLTYQDLYFGFEYLSQDPIRPGCLMARLPVRLEFWRFEKGEQSKKMDVAVFQMKPGSPSMEIVDCADGWQHDDRL
jgi:hypothetical protein